MRSTLLVFFFANVYPFVLLRTKIIDAFLQSFAVPQCGLCGREARTENFCKKCRHVFYCSAKCKRIHYHVHKDECSDGNAHTENLHGAAATRTEVDNEEGSVPHVSRSKDCTMDLLRVLNVQMQGSQAAHIPTLDEPQLASYLLSLVKPQSDGENNQGTSPNACFWSPTIESMRTGNLCLNSGTGKRSSTE